MTKQKTLPHFPFYPADFISKTGRLTDAQVGAYIRLLCEQWITGDIPLVDASADASALRMISESIDKSWPAISKYFERVGDGMKNPRMEEVRLKAIDIYTKRVKSANDRWEKENASADASDNASASATQNPKPITDNTKHKNTHILRAHEAYRLICSRKPSQHEIAQITTLVSEKGLDVVLTALEVCGDYKWDKISHIKKVISGEWPRKDRETDKKIDTRTTADLYRELPDE